MKVHCLAAATAFLPAAAVANSIPTAHLPQADVTYHGYLDSSIEHFLNIKFAHETSGKRRFAPPEPFTPPTGSVIEATKPGAACPQLQDPVPPAFDGVEEISEDCLNLRIARPQGTDANARLPVVVWMHGGGVVRGTAYDSHFDPSKLLELSVSSGKPVIYAAIQSRLSIFGFAKLQPLEDDHSLNIGLRDQRAAFEWLKANVENFGGDPDRITAFGQSAGGTFLSLQTFAFGGTKGLPFDQGWAMSGPPGTSLNTTSDMTSYHTTNVAKRLNCPLGDESKILTCLRKASMKDVLKTAMDYSIENRPPLGMFTFLPSVDDDFLPDRPSSLLREGKFVKGVPMVHGWTQDDGDMNAGPAPMINSVEDMIGAVRQFASELSASEMSGLCDLYPAEDFQESVDNYNARKQETDPPVSPYYFATSRVLRDLLFTCPSFDYSYHMMKRSRLDPSHKSRFDDVRLYSLNQSVYPPMYSAVGMPWVGVGHGSDISYIFNGILPEMPMQGPHLDLAKAMSSSLIEFAHNGKPAASSAKSKAFKSWPAAYDSIDDGTDDLMPRHFNLEVIGGPYGTASTLVTHSDSTRSSQNHGIASGHGADYDAGLADGLGLGKIQEVLSSNLGLGAMENGPSPVLAGRIARENLFERCAYINSLSKSLGI